MCSLCVLVLSIGPLVTNREKMNCLQLSISSQWDCHVTLVHCLTCSLCVPVMNGSFNYRQGEHTMHAKNIKLDCYIFMTFGACLVNIIGVLYTIL